MDSSLKIFGMYSFMTFKLFIFLILLLYSKYDMEISLYHNIFIYIFFRKYHIFFIIYKLCGVIHSIMSKKFFKNHKLSITKQNTFIKNFINNFFKSGFISFRNRNLNKMFSLIVFISYCYT